MLGSGKVGTGFVPIKPDTQGFGSELEKGLDKEGVPAAKRSGDKLAKAAAGAFAGGIALLGKSVMDFGGFEKQMNEVFTLLPGISGEAMDKMTDQVKGFATEFGVIPQEVVPALYQSLSAGVPSDNVFTFLETSQKLAKGGVTDLTTAVDGLSSVVNAYGSDVLSAEQASDLMFTTVKLGKTNISELSGALFQVTPTAAGLGVAFGDVSAALAAMTLQGVPTSVATTQLRQLFVELSKEGSAAAGTFEELSGKSFRDFIAAGGNVQDALQVMEKGAADTGLSISDMFGSVEAGNAALALTGGGTEAFTNALTGMDSAAGATDAAFAQMNQGLSATLDKLKVKFSIVLLNIGKEIAPTIGMIGENVGMALELFAMLPGPMQAIVVLFGTMTAGAFAFAKPIMNGIALFKQLNGVFTMLAANPWTLVLIGLVLVTVLIIKNWDKVKTNLAATWGWMQLAGQATADFFNALWADTAAKTAAAWNAAATAIGSALTSVGQFFTDLGSTAAAGFGEIRDAGGIVVGWLVAIPGTVGGAFEGLASIISTPFIVAFQGIKEAWNATAGGFGFTTPSWIPGFGGKGFKIPEMALGGVLTSPRLVMAGEYPGANRDPEIVAPQSIIRETMLDALGSGEAAGGDINVTVEMHVASEVRDPGFFERQATEITRVVVRELERTGRGRGAVLVGANR